MPKGVFWIKLFISVLVNIVSISILFEKLPYVYACMYVFVIIKNRKNIKCLKTYD